MAESGAFGNEQQRRDSQESTSFSSIAVTSYGAISDLSNDESQHQQVDEPQSAKKVPFQWFSLIRKISWVSLINMAIICLVLFGYGMCFSLFSPFFPNEALRKGMNATMVGLLFGSYELVMFIGTPISGKAIHHLGLRFMIGAGMLLAGGSTMLFGVLDQSPDGTIYIVLCFAARIVEAIGASLYLTASYCVAGNMFPGNIAFIYSLMETSNGVGSMIGPSAGGLLYAADGFYVPFVTVGAILLGFGFFSTILIPASAINGEVAEVDEDGNRRKVKRKKKPSVPWSRLFHVSIETWIITCAEATAAIVSNFTEPTLSIYLESLGLSDPATIGVIFLCSSIVYTVVCVIVGHLADKYPTSVYWMMTSGALWTAIWFFLMGPPPFVEHLIAPSVALTATAEILLYCGIALVLIPVPRALLNVAKDAGCSEGLETSAMIAGLYNGLWFMGGFVGPPLAGFLLENVGFQWGATVMAFASLGLFVVLGLGATYNRMPCYLQGRQFAYTVLDEEQAEQIDSEGEEGEEGEEEEGGEIEYDDEGVDINSVDPFSPTPLISRSYSSTASSVFVGRPKPGHGIFAVSVSLN